MTVQLEKGSGGVGFTVEGGKGSIHGDKPIVIKKILTGTGPSQSFYLTSSANWTEICNNAPSQVKLDPRNIKVHHCLSLLFIPPGVSSATSLLLQV